MLLKDDPTRLRHILEAAEEAILFSEGLNRDDLESNRAIQFAIVRCIEIIGEAAARLSQELRDAHPRIPWRKMIATRNRIVHAYFDLDLDIL